MRRRAWLALAAFAAVCASVATLWFTRAPSAPPDAVLPAPAPARAASAASLHAAAVAPVLPAALPVSAAHRADQIELCGGIWVKTGPDGRIDEDDFNRVADLPGARARLLDALRADPGEFARAATIRLGLVASEPPLLTSADTLARMASTTRDPQVYALAFNLCVGRPNEGACQLLSAEQWARLDPGNAAPWTFALDRTLAARDTSAQNEALHRIATSQRSELYYFALPGLVLDHVPNDDAAIPVALTLAIEAIGVEAAHVVPGYQATTRLCRGAALRDANRRQTCNAVAELLVARSDTVIERMMGMSIGAQLGWPAERIDRLRGEYTAYNASLNAENMLVPTSGCANIRRDLETVRQRARLGEAGALREWVAQSGKTAEDFIRIEREGRARIAADAASAAASAASAPR